MEKIKKFFKLRKKSEEEYEKAKEEFEKALGKPTIRFKVEIPKGYEDMIPEFMELEKDEKFKGKIERLVERTLKKERKEKTETKSEQKSDDL